ncbi:hypothetical protein CANCADRAFT_1937 [Tortispora caseinolytica NRRL Y-17796]|uniref:PhoD-like phosphatase metallophosphatase domain-containing protein n=1 Tax=Tortispora caseinolytica NRRL Y-17796 TaxID=767744 RepID=A0A1E4TEW7_9ASCO|nr:hypothetical protein CANCADRAFT_1937 [Tortispora caseinolytica NRRL Y-17796]
MGLVVLGLFFKKPPQHSKALKKKPNNSSKYSWQYENGYSEPVEIGSSLWDLVLVTLGYFDRYRPVMFTISLTINLLLAYFAYDFIYAKLNYPTYDLTYMRAGYVNQTSATLSLRAPNVTRPFNIEMVLLDTGNYSITVAEIAPVDLFESTDYTATVTVNNLLPGTKYMFFSSDLNRSVTLTTEPLPQFVDKFSFLSVSCMLPHFPYSPLQDPRHIAAFDLYREQAANAQFMVFLGDFIYADVPYSLSEDRSYYQMLYRQVYYSMTKEGNEAWTNLPLYNILDDHEIVNDFDNTQGDSVVRESVDFAWDFYQGDPNPPSVRPDSKYFQFTYLGLPFFCADTRTHRSPNAASDGPEKTMLGKTQLDDLISWLYANKDQPFKFVFFSVPFTKNWRTVIVNEEDTWAGYLHERNKILRVMQEVGGVVILTGDRHEAGSVEFPPQKHGDYPVYEFSTSPFQQYATPGFYIEFEQFDQEDVMLNYISGGKQKLGQFDVDLSRKHQPILTYNLWIDGKVAWQYTIVGYTKRGTSFNGKRLFW